MAKPEIRLKGFKGEWESGTFSTYAKPYFISNKFVHHQNLLSLSYGKIVQKDIKANKGLLPASFDTYQIVKDGIIVFRFTDLQNDHKSLRVGILLMFVLNLKILILIFYIFRCIRMI